MASDDFTQGEILKVLKSIDEKLTFLTQAVTKAESEVPEYVRRFTMYYSDLAHSRWLYDSLGLPLGPEINQELQRAHDRMQHIITDENQQGGTFWRVRQNMIQRGKDDPKANRFDHSRRNT